MVKSFQIKENTELFSTNSCGPVLVVDLPPLAGWVIIGNIYGDNSIMIDEEEWDAFVDLVNTANIRIQEVKRGN